MSKTLTTLSLIFLLFFTSTFAIANPTAWPLEPRGGDPARRLDLHINRLAVFGFSGSVLVARGRKIVFHKACGLADRANKIPVTTSTLFDIASITKQFTASAILKLEMAGRLRTDDPISRFIPNAPADKSAITLHQLLTHTSGLPAVLEGVERASRLEFIEGILGAKLDSAPGSKYSYSNAGYTLLAAIIEIVSGHSYESFLREELFKPAGMNGTGFYEDRTRWADGLVARGYDEATDRGAPTEWKPDYRFRGSSYVLTNAGDLFKWELALKGETILSREAKRKMFAAHTETDEPGRSYGYGWIIEKTPRHRISHDGIGFGFNTVFERNIDEDITVIALSNITMGRLLPMVPLGRDISSIIFDGKQTRLPATMSIAEDRIQKFAGEYELPSGAKLTVSAEGGLKISAEGQEAIDLLAGASGDERKKLADFTGRSRAVFEAIARGDFDPILSEMKGRAAPDEIRKAVEAMWARFIERHGQFKSIDALGTVPETEAMMSYVRLNFERGSEYRRCRWERGALVYILQVALPLIPTRLAPKSETEFYGYHLGLARVVRLSFNLDSAGAVTGLTFHSDGGKSVARRLNAVRASLIPSAR
jgi:CubicO group peptidase (beta-lactamase class C family)